MKTILKSTFLLVITGILVFAMSCDNPLSFKNEDNSKETEVVEKGSKPKKNQPLPVNAPEEDKAGVKTFKVYNADTLQKVGTGKDGWTLDANYIQTRDIVLNRQISAIGEDDHFTGTYDGQGYTITGLNINSDKENQGLFSYLDGGTLRNIRLIDCYIAGLENTGGIVGYNYQGTVENCSVIGGEVYGTEYVGGVAGYNRYGNVENCYTTAEIYSDTNQTGDITGENYKGFVTPAEEILGSVSLRQEGSTLIADAESQNGAGLNVFIWKRSDSESGDFTVIDGVRENSYTPVPSDEGKYVTVEAWWTGNIGSVESEGAVGPIEGGIKTAGVSIPEETESDEEEESPNYEDFTFYNDVWLKEWNPPSTGGLLYVIFATSDWWVVDCNANWLDANPKKGSGKGLVYLYAGPNTSTESRSGTIVINSLGSQTRTVNVSQKGAKPILELSDPGAIVSSWGGSTPWGKFSITSNTSWTMESDSSWLTTAITNDGTHSTQTSGDGNKDFIIYFEENLESSSRTGILTVTTTDGKVKRTMPITQPNKVPSLDVNVTEWHPAAISQYANGLQTANVRIISNLAWTASSDADWLTITPDSGNNSNLSVKLTVTNNTSTEARIGTITITAPGFTKTIIVTQEGNVRFEVSIDAWDAPIAGGSTSVAINTTLSWTASSDASWLNVRPASGTGGSLFSLYADENKTTEPRIAIVTVNAGSLIKTITVTQAKAGTLEVSLLDWEAPPEGGSITVEITSTTDWTVSVDGVPRNWLFISASSGTGNGSITITADPNNTSPNWRINTVYINCGRISKSIRVLQYAVPGYVSDNLYVFDAGKGVLNIQETSAAGGSTDVQIQTGLSWTATSDASWLKVTPASGTGFGIITLTTTVNTDLESRNATVTINAGNHTKTVQVRQRGSLEVGILKSDGSYENNFTSWIALGAGYITLTIKPRGDKSIWTASSDAKWLIVTPVTGMGNGSLNLIAMENTSGATRYATCTVQSGSFIRTVNVTQGSVAPTIDISPDSWDAPWAGGSKTLEIRNNGSWTTSCNASWLTVSPASGTGNGTITLTANENSSTEPRIGIVSVLAGTNRRYIIVNQEEKNGGYSISVEPIGITFPARNEDYDFHELERSVKVTNTGHKDTGPLKYFFTEVGSDDFSDDFGFRKADYIDNIKPFQYNDSSILIIPTVYTPGTYFATFKVTGEHGIYASFDVSFTVNSSGTVINPPPPPPPPPNTTQYAIKTYGVPEHGEFTLSHTKATQYTEVKITTKPATGYVTDKVLVQREGDGAETPVSGADNLYWFSMPPNVVYVSVTFKSGTTPPPPTPTYGITLNPSTARDFGNVTVGYQQPAAHEVTVSNPAGNQPTGILDVELEGNNPNAFRLSKNSINSINAGSSNSFTVQPITGLNAGTYTAIVKVSNKNVPAQRFQVSFTVNSAPPTPTYSITKASTSNGSFKVLSGNTEITQSVSGAKLFISATPSNSTYGTWEVKVVTSSGTEVKVESEDNTFNLYSFKMPTSNVRVTVNFLPRMAIKTEIGVGAGTIDVYTPGGDHTCEFPGRTVTIEVRAQYGYNFVGFLYIRMDQGGKYVPIYTEGGGVYSNGEQLPVIGSYKDRQRYTFIMPVTSATIHADFYSDGFPGHL